MNYTLTQVMTAISDGTIAIDDGIAQLTRLKYYKPYDNYINPGQYIPVFYFNPIDLTTFLNNTSELSFTQPDLFVADDWLILNQSPIHFTGSIQANTNTITNTSKVLTVGMYINGNGIPQNSIITVANAGIYTLDNNATVSNNLASLAATFTYSTGV